MKRFGRKQRAVAVIAAVSTDRMQGERRMTSTYPFDPAIERIGALLERLDPTPTDTCNIEGCTHHADHELRLALAEVGTA